MSYYPYIEKQIVWSRPLKLWINSLRTEDWYGLVGFYHKSGADFTKALENMCNWNPYTRDMIEVGDTVIDVGANEGMTTCLFALKVGPHGRVLAIEPDANNCELIRKNVELNGLTNVEIFQRVCGERAGDVVQFIDERVYLDKSVGVPVDTMTLDDLISYKPNFVKIDVEGFEVPVLRGAAKVLALSPKMEVELHLSEDPAGVNMTRMFGYNPAEIIDLLQRVHRYELRQDGAIVKPGVVPRGGSIWCQKGEVIIHAIPGDHNL